MRAFLKRIGISRSPTNEPYIEPSTRYPYGDYWSPETEDEAMRLIIEPYMSWEKFEESGRQGAEQIKQLLPDRESAILDFGCGIGRILKYLTDYRQLYGVDVSSRMLAMARERIPADNLDLIHITGCTLPLEDESVDLVYSFWVLQHIDREDVAKLVKEFYRILKPGGLCYLQFPGYGDGEMGRDTRPWTQQGIRELLEDFHLVSFKQENSLVLWVDMYVLVQKEKTGAKVQNR